MDFEMRLDYQDSNLDKQNQNLLCYHYTIVQRIVWRYANIQSLFLPFSVFYAFYAANKPLFSDPAGLHCIESNDVISRFRIMLEGV